MWNLCLNTNKTHPCLVNVLWSWIFLGEGPEFLCPAFWSVSSQGALTHSCLKYQSLHGFLQEVIDLWRERFIHPSSNGEISPGLVTLYENRVWRMSPAQHTIHMCVGGFFLVRHGVFTHQRKLLPGVLVNAAIPPRTTGRRQCESPCSLPSSPLYWVKRQVCTIQNYTWLPTAVMLKFPWKFAFAVTLQSCFCLSWILISFLLEGKEAWVCVAHLASQQLQVWIDGVLAWRIVGWWGDHPGQKQQDEKSTELGGWSPKSGINSKVRSQSAVKR